MSSFALPSELQYRNSLPSLSAGAQSMEQCLLPINGQTFSCATAGTQVIWDLPAKGFLVPNSVYIKYKGNVFTNGGLASIRGTPVYAPIYKLETIFGSSPQEGINGYNQVQNMVSNCSLNVAQKFGLQAGYGYRNDPAVAAAPTLESLDGRICAVDALGAAAISFSAPLPCLLSNAEKLVPLGMMPTVRIQLTLDSVANIFGTTGAVAADVPNGINAVAATIVPLNYVLSDFQFCYTMVDFGAETDAAVRSMGETLYIKSQSFTNSAQTINAATLGTVELVYSQRLASVKSLFLHASCQAIAIGINGSFDAFEITTGGDYQFSIAGKYWPPRPISAGDNKSGILMELKKAVGSIYDTTNNFSIDAVEGTRTMAAASTISSPSKCYIGVNTEILPSNTVLLSGVSTQSSPITARINIAVATQQASLVSLIACYDAIIEVRPDDKSAIVRQ